MRLRAQVIIALLLLGSAAHGFALGYTLDQVEHDWSIDGPGGRYGLIQFAPYSPLVGRRTLVMFAGKSQEIPITAPWAAALVGVVAMSVGFAVLFRRRGKP